MNKHESILYLYKSHCIFDHIFDNISYILNNNNIKHIISDIIDDDENKLWLGIWNDTNKIPKKYIILNTEPLFRDYWNKQIIPVIKNSLFCIDYSFSHIKLYSQINFFNYKIIPYGYCNNNEIIFQKYKSNTVKDIDIDRKSVV